MSDANALIRDYPPPAPGQQPFGPFLTPSGSLRIPSTLPQFPAFVGRVPTPADSRAATPVTGSGQADPVAELGADCLEAATRTTIQPHLVYDPGGGGDSPTPSFALCIAPPAALPLPTHVLHLTFTACDETLLVPIHHSIWAIKTRLFAQPDSPLSPPPPPYDPPLPRQNLISLPIVRYAVPFKTIWSILYEFVHTGSTAAVLANLLTHQVPPSPLSAEPRQRYQLGALIAKLERIRRLWHDVVALGAEDEELWEALARAWAVLLAELTEELNEPV
ncbi:hypothetical protein Rt10032_c11g4575 [Rhodotorula toruloides]|uniref:Clp1-like protein n=1 Tax=Rhodotorula toruloides TaxID=5286 RepID=A0A511KJJ7_RHOTO|nr:hypothetical protein Rt10032_c11g4575 [Rhodotorula toruloides]